MESVVKESKVGCVIVLTLSDTTGRNLLSIRMRQLLLDALKNALADEHCRVIVLTGDHGNFCAGGDVRDMEIPNTGIAQERLNLVHQIIRLIACGPKPVVAAVNGIAAGGGVSLLAACDHVVASVTARFTSSFLRTGVLPDLGALWAVSQRMGGAQARRFFTLGNTFLAKQAHQIGLVDAVVTAEALMPESIRIANSLGEIAPLTFSAFKEAFANYAGTFESALAAERRFQPDLLTSNDHKEAVAAFLQKRRARFTGS
ncbi:enoyl-CoA hydratase/isomerase family protein [Alcaligenaceae bacterium]|nr:enoyl-CoA hydratase/isomerase family protein [Alcaligenaceae bacterium]